MSDCNQSNHPNKNQLGLEKAAKLATCYRLLCGNVELDWKMPRMEMKLWLTCLNFRRHIKSEFCFKVGLILRQPVTFFIFWAKTNIAFHSEELKSKFKHFGKNMPDNWHCFNLESKFCPLLPTSCGFLWFRPTRFNRGFYLG